MNDPGFLRELMEARVPVIEETIAEVLLSNEVTQDEIDRDMAQALKLVTSEDFCPYTQPDELARAIALLSVFRPRGCMFLGRQWRRPLRSMLQVH